MEITIKINGQAVSVEVSYLPTPYPGGQPLLTSDKWEEIKALIESKPDKTLNEIIEEPELPIHKSRLSVLLMNPL